MRIEKIKNSSLLKPGELLVVSKCCKFYGNSTLLHLPKSRRNWASAILPTSSGAGSRISRAKHGRIFRRPRTTNERRAHFSNNATEEILESYGVALKLRQKRKWHMLPNAYHDLSLRYQRSWKEHRRNQQKSAGSINRRIHSPPFWVS